jgi:hypothetical protein
VWHIDLHSAFAVERECSQRFRSSVEPSPPLSGTCRLSIIFITSCTQHVAILARMEESTLSACFFSSPTTTKKRERLELSMHGPHRSLCANRVQPSPMSSAPLRSRKTGHRRHSLRSQLTDNKNAVAFLPQLYRHTAYVSLLLSHDARLNTTFPYASPRKPKDEDGGISQCDCVSLFTQQCRSVVSVT